MKIYLLIILVLTLISCRERTKKYPFSDEIEIYNMNPGEGKKMSTSSLFDSISYIPLETTKDIVIGSIDKMEAFDSYFFILDKRTKKIWCFDSLGKYIFQIDKKGKGPGEYLDIFDFNIDKENKQILVLDRNSQKILYYDFSGQYLKDVQLDVKARLFALLNNKFLLYTSGVDIYMKKENNDYGYNLFLSDLNGKVEHRFFIYNEITDNLWRHNVFVKNKTGVMFHYARNDTIYNFNDNGELTVKYLFDFDKQRMPLEKILDKTKLSSYTDNPNYVNISEIYCSDLYTFIAYTYERRSRFILRNNETNKIINVRFLENDIDFISFANPLPVNMKGNKIYYIKEAGDIMTMEKDNILLYKKINKLSNLKEDDNSVIIICYIRNDV